MNKYVFALLLGFSLCSNSLYASNTCVGLFNPTVSLVTLTAKLKTQSKPTNTAYSQYLKLSSEHRAIGQVFKKSEVLEVLVNEEMSYRRVALIKIMAALTSSTVTSHTKSTLTTLLSRQLVNRVPESTILPRIESFLNQEPNSLVRILGDMTLKEVQLLTYGKNPLKPSPDSLLGQYIAKTGAATTVRRFSKGPGKSRETGEPRLVVAMSESSFAEYLKLFQNVHFLIHVHTREQGTLMVAHNGRVGSYASLNSDLRSPGYDTLMPHILLSSTEANRVGNFFELGNLNGEIAQRPWELRNEKEESSYCARGGYSSCTHWFGNIPMGDAKVAGYAFPGRVDQHADYDVKRGRQYQDLMPYDIKGYTPAQKKLLNIVWTAPGHAQLSTVLGLERNNIAGEFASPGFVAVSLTAAAPAARVPFVFRIVEDHRAEFAPNFKTYIHAY